MPTSTPELMGTVLSLAAGALIKATVLLALVAIAAHLLRRRSAALRHLLWTFAIVGLVALPVVTPLVPFQWRVLPEMTSRGAAEPVEALDPSSPPARNDEQRDEAAPPPPVSEATPATESVGVDRTADVDFTTV